MALVCVGGRFRAPILALRQFTHTSQLSTYTSHNNRPHPHASPANHANPSPNNCITAQLCKIGRPDEVLRIVQSSMRIFNSINVVTALLRLATTTPPQKRASVVSNRVFQQLMNKVHRCLPEVDKDCGVRGLTNVVTSLVKLTQPDSNSQNTAWPAQTLGICNQAFSLIENYESNLPIRSVPLLLWAYGKLDVQHPKVLRNLLEVMTLQVTRIDTHALCDSIWAVAVRQLTDQAQSLDSTNEFFCACAQELQQRLQVPSNALSVEDTCKVVWALSVSQITRHDALQHKHKLFTVLVPRIVRELPRFTSLQMQCAMWAFAKSRLIARDLFIAVRNEVETNFARFETQSLISLAWSFSRVGIDWQNIFWALETRFQNEGAPRDTTKLSACLWACGESGIVIDSLMLRLEELVQSNKLLVVCDTQTLVVALCCVAKLGAYPRMEFLYKHVDQLFASEALVLQTDNSQPSDHDDTEVGDSNNFGFGTVLNHKRQANIHAARSSRNQLSLLQLCCLAWANCVVWRVNSPIVAHVASLPWDKIGQMVTTAEHTMLLQCYLALQFSAAPKPQMSAGFVQLAAEVSQRSPLRIPSPPHVEISQVLWDELKFAHTMEYITNDGLSIDIVTDPNMMPRFAIEVDGPNHMMLCRNPDGPTRFKHELLQRMGWTVVSLRVAEWCALANDATQRAAWLQSKLKAAGVPLELHCNKEFVGFMTN